MRLVVNSCSSVQVGREDSKPVVAEVDLLPQIHIIPNLQLRRDSVCLEFWNAEPGGTRLLSWLIKN